MRANLQPVTEVKRRATELIKELQETKQPMLITQHGRAAAVMMDIESYEAMQRRMEIMEAIAQGERAWTEGRVLPHETVMKEMRAKFGRSQTASAKTKPRP